MYSNDKLVLQLISLLKKFNVCKIVVSPGSRHNKLVTSLANDDYFELYSVVDERSAAFFAIGLIQSSNEPVAITCSSGTACMNYGSAIVEAYYQRLPLLVLSSDRVPEVLNQGEDQMYDQLSSFASCTKYHCQLPIIDTMRDEWYCNRIINEALIALNHRGRGPVHINIPFAEHHGTKFDVKELPDVRKISLHQLPLNDDGWCQISHRLIGKKILIIWGQSVFPLSKTEKAVSKFVQKYNATVLTDKISNCHCDNSVLNTLLVLSLMTSRQKEILYPDIVISIGGNYIFNLDLKGWLKEKSFEHWIVGEEGVVCDPFHVLNDIFEMPEYYFFEKLAEEIREIPKHDYFESWRKLSEKPSLPKINYCELYAITSLLSRLPKNVDLQLSNSQTIRMAQYTPLDSSIRVYCNRGVNGIDGSLSTAVGFGADSERMLYYITGDLSFFYDMNALSIKHLSNNMRIMLINNDGGSVMYDAPKDTSVDLLPIYLAAGQHKEARGWVESMGFKYLSARNKEEVDEGITTLLNESISQPIFLEVFTSLSDDSFCMGEYLRTQDQRTLLEKVEGRLIRLIKK